MTDLSVVVTARYHVHFVKNGHSLPNAVLILQDFKPRLLMHLLSSTEERFRSMLGGGLQRNSTRKGKWI